MSIFSDYDRYLFHQGKNYDAYRRLGAHQWSENGATGVYFATWAPNASSVNVVCDALGWENEHPMWRSDDGIWEGFVPGIGLGTAYRFAITGPDGEKHLKSDPYAFQYQLRPDNASIVTSLREYMWWDGEYMSRRSNKDVLERPMAIYEIHLGSWKKNDQGEDGFLNYRELADQLADYVSYMGYTHVELMGICEYPFDPSWGYQVTGYYAPTSRYGTPDDFRYFVDRLHRSNIGVILDWVPAHFPKDEFAMGRFDGTPLYESADPLRQEFPVWGTYAFDHGKPEVRSFLMSSAFYWINEFHIDALRVDAVAAMQYADFSRKQWRPNINGGRINYESTNFLKQLTCDLTYMSNGFLIAEDSSTEQGITADVNVGGLGFTLKWNMGWMFDTLKYLSYDFHERRHHHGELTHVADYVFTENFVNVLSHDEVHKYVENSSLIRRMPGSYEDKFGGLKALYTFQFTFPGKKLLFMGQDFAQDNEWDVLKSLDWHLCDEPKHRDVMQTMRRLLSVYKEIPALHSDSKDPKIFEWVNRNYADANIISFIRKNPWNYGGAVLVIINFSPWKHNSYTCGVPMGGAYTRVFSTYDSVPGAGGPDEIGGYPKIYAQNGGCDGKPFRLSYGLRPFEAVIIKLP
jgi:1,4-alpha-glucan branching enzyme